MPQSEISDLIIELQIGNGGRGELQGALRPHGRADRAAGRRCDERKSEGSLSRQSGVRRVVGRTPLLRTRVRAEAATARSAARALVFWQSPA